MKVKVTKKQVLESYSNVIELSYCALQHILNRGNARFYTCGVYGWNADIYEINNNTVIVTGYRPFGNILPSYDLVKEYDYKAQLILANAGLDYTQKEQKINELLCEFIDIAKAKAKAK